jgi:Transcriptional regulators
MRSATYSGPVDELDIKIMEYFKVNARASLRDIAKAVGKSPSVVHSRLRRLEKMGVVKGYTAIIDYRALGYEVYALTLLQVEGGHITDVEKLLASEPNVRAVFDITGEYDVAILTVFSTVSKLDEFIKKMLKVPYIKRSVTNLILRVVKDSPHITSSPP